MEKEDEVNELRRQVAEMRKRMDEMELGQKAFADKMLDFALASNGTIQVMAKAQEKTIDQLSKNMVDVFNLKSKALAETKEAEMGDSKMYG
jgi:hypothetical protein